MPILEKLTRGCTPLLLFILKSMTHDHGFLIMSPVVQNLTTLIVTQCLLPKRS